MADSQKIEKGIQVEVQKSLKGKGKEIAREEVDVEDFNDKESAPAKTSIADSQPDLASKINAPITKAASWVDGLTIDEFSSYTKITGMYMYKKAKPNFYGAIKEDTVWLEINGKRDWKSYIQRQIPIAQIEKERQVDVLKEHCASKYLPQSEEKPLLKLKLLDYYIQRLLREMTTYSKQRGLADTDKNVLKKEAEYHVEEAAKAKRRIWEDYVDA
ncbi:uncharacterized protein LY89DRAFT_733355 [Mollisia scopiformis]|uniref:Uncharacterized protein n=1 Tax=Mollisia scopiformis TaxID=149040 RepID=A0A194XBG8_MOLSC|nr:uncharacterized protein LY89DRAFT_733355 [Mollisia scopiformis]KUJ17509.1 hypothetical protein LY89DRAFT_733355 [Mollisia scopiformis]